jgi:predicted transcriptional regulator
MVGSKIEGSSVNAEVTAEEISAYTGLPKDQVSARAKECVDEGFAERTNRGSYKARQFKIEAFVGGLVEDNSPKRGNK